MNIVYHEKPFKITKDNFPFGAHEDATVHVVDNFLTPELHRFWDSQIVSSSLWSKTNQVGSDSKTGLPQHSFWGGTSIESEWDQVFKCIKKCHEVLHSNGVPRIYTTLKVNTRIGKKQFFNEKVESIRS